MPVINLSGTSLKAGSVPFSLSFFQASRKGAFPITRAPPPPPAVMIPDFTYLTGQSKLGLVGAVLMPLFIHHNQYSLNCTLPSITAGTSLPPPSPSTLNGM